MDTNPTGWGLRWWGELLLGGDHREEQAAAFLLDIPQGDMELDRRRNLRVALAFLGHKKFFERCSKDTLDHYRGILDRLLAHLDGKPIGAVTTQDIKRFLEPMEIGPASLRVYRSNIHTFYVWAVAEGEAKTNPVEGIPVPHEPKRTPRGLPPAQVTRLLTACVDDRERVICVLMVQQGLRVGEVASLEIADLDFLTTPPVMRVIGKGDKERILPITEETQRILKPYIGGRTWGKVIRNHRKGDGVTRGTIGRIFGEVRDRAAVQSVAHQLRHTCAHGMIASGAHLIDVQQALGHESLRTTQRYLPWTVGDLATAMGGRKYLA